MEKKKNVLRTTHVFFTRGKFFVSHFLLWHLVSESYWTHHESSLTVTISTSLHSPKDQMKFKPNILSELLSKFKAPYLQKYFTSSNPPGEFGTLFLFSYSILLPPLTHSILHLRTLFTFISILCVFGFLLLASLFTSSHPS